MSKEKEKLDLHFAALSKGYKVCLALAPIALLMGIGGVLLLTLADQKTVGLTLTVLGFVLAPILLLTALILRSYSKKGDSLRFKAALKGIRESLGPQAALETDHARIPADILIQTGISPKPVKYAGAKIFFDDGNGLCTVFECSTENTSEDNLKVAASVFAAAVEAPQSVMYFAFNGLGAVLDGIVGKFIGTVFVFSDLSVFRPVPLSFRSKKAGTTQSFQPQNILKIGDSEFDKSFETAIPVGVTEANVEKTLTDSLMSLKKLYPKGIIASLFGNNLVIGIDGEFLGLTHSLTGKKDGLKETYLKGREAAEKIKATVETLKPLLTAGKE